ncbi:DUF4817 domain-containing protein [Trichonephila clavipes]|nr:DUF4817 domain-containing protein [Trichonephila clavipes]
MSSGRSLPQINLGVQGGIQRDSHKIMHASSSSVNPTPLAHADTPRYILPRGGISQTPLAGISSNFYLEQFLQLAGKKLFGTFAIATSDEAHFWLNGYVNKQNCRIWSEANPEVYVETPLHPEKLTVWCALWAGGIIGPYFFKNDEGHNVTVNGDRYRAMITNFFIPELNNHDVQELWFQQDGATCHTARATIDLLKDTFGDRLISRFGLVNWPPRSCDLTPLDYFCGAM